VLSRVHLSVHGIGDFYPSLIFPWFQYQPEGQRMKGIEKGKKPSEKITIWLWGGVFILFLILLTAGGGLALYSGVKKLAYSYASKNWPSTAGRIISSSAKISSSSGSSGSKAAMPTYSADIRYAYEVDEKDYHNNRVGYGDYGSSDKSHAQKIVDRYPVGKDVSVYYKSDNPDESILEHHSPGKIVFIQIVVGSVFTFIGSVIFILLFRAMNKKRQL
jgi:hypothetical protein